MIQREGPEKVIFLWFSGFHPSMVSRASLGRLPGSKAHQNGGPDMDFLLFRDHAFTFFGSTLEYFLCSMNYKLIVLDVQFTVVFVQAWGENLRWMPPRCLPDASQMPPRCRLTAASQMPPR